MPYLGNQPRFGKAERFIFTASGGETSVTQDDNGVPIGYSVGQLDVYLNGVKLVPSDDFTASDGSSINFSSSLNTDDIVQILAFDVLSIGSSIQSFSDVTLTGIQTDDRLRWDGTQFVPISGEVGSLTDVSTSGIQTDDGLVWNGSQFVPGPAGGGKFYGENGTTGSRPGDIFRANEATLNTDVTIPAGENASAAGPLKVADGVTLKVDGNLTVI